MGEILLKLMPIKDDSQMSLLVKHINNNQK